MASLLKGSTLLTPTGEPFKGSLEGKYLMLYFSASWCPPCKAFSPILCEWYKKHGARGDLEMVFVSSDRDLASFKAYSAHFPFPAIAYEDRAVKQKLSQEYGITGIPSLIVVDPKGELVTKNGREGVTARPEAFPWTPKTLGQELEGPLLRADGSRIANATEHLRGKKVALYFSASWCGPCKKFSPVLIECYKSLQAAGKPFEVIFVSADHDQESFDAYFKHMPWTALPYGDPRIEALNGLLEVEGIPTTILVDGDSYRILNKELRGVVMQDPKGEQFPWRPQPVSILSEAFLGHINDVACVLLFLPEGRKAAEFDPILRGTAARILDEAEASGKDAKLRFAIAEHDNQLGASIRSFLNQSPQKEPELVLLDIPSARKFLLRGAPITPELVAETAKDFLANSLKNSRGIKDGDFVPKPPAAGHGHSHGGEACHGHGGHDEVGEEEEEEEEHHHAEERQSGQGHSHGGAECHGHGGH